MTLRIGAQATTKTSALRSCFTTSEDTTVIYGVDLTSDPPYSKYWLNIDPLIYLKCARALPLATSRDIVLLNSLPNTEYIEWLKLVGLGSCQILAYPSQNTSQSLAELVLSNPDPILNTLSKIGTAPSQATYVPYYGGKKEAEVAQKLGVNFFGCAESITLKYYDKALFKERLQKLGILTVDGDAGQLNSKFFGLLRTSSVAKIVSTLLRSHSSLIVRGTLGASGSSAYKIDPDNVEQVLTQIREENPNGKFLIEPLLNVIVSPNDQWCVSPNGSIVHLGITAQIFEGLKHGGNLCGQYFSPRVTDYIRETSEKIVSSMAKDGYQGVIGIDYIVTDDKIYPIENNARLNGSTFAIGIVERIASRHGPVPAWKFYRAKVAPCSFSQLRDRTLPILYEGRGINKLFPFDVDKLPIDGSFTVLLLAEDIYHIQYLEEVLEAIGVAPI